MSDIRSQSIRGLAPGAVFSLTRTFTEADTEAFGHITRDYNQVHYDREFARSKGFSGLICHGLLFGSMICEVGGQLAWLAGGMSFKFIAPVYFGDTVTCVMTIAESDAKGRARAEARFTTADGRLVATATLKGRLPVGDDRERLREMVAQGDPTNPLAHGRRAGPDRVPARGRKRGPS